LGSGVVALSVGVFFRFARRVRKDSRLWPAAFFVAGVFGYAPRSWIPWGSALICVGISTLLPSEAVITQVVRGLAVLLLVVGVVFIFVAPWWMTSMAFRKRPS
jgi:hypothetical protein